MSKTDQCNDPKYSLDCFFISQIGNYSAQWLVGPHTFILIQRPQLYGTGDFSSRIIFNVLQLCDFSFVSSQPDESIRKDKCILFLLQKYLNLAYLTNFSYLNLDNTVQTPTKRRVQNASAKMSLLINN